MFPRALVQWEDFASAQRVRACSTRYRRRLPSFNDDIQGTGAVVVAGIQSALRQTGGRLEDARVVFFGAGASGPGSALAVRAAHARGGRRRRASFAARPVPRLAGADPRGRPGLDGAKREIAADPALVAGWRAGAGGAFELADVVAAFKPTVLVGASGQPGAFTEAIVRDMLRGCPRPIVLALSNRIPRPK